jgi:hypothetical protein
VRGRLAILGATVGGALERSLDVAAVLEMRGYGAGRRGVSSTRALSRHDLAFAAAAVSLLLLATIAAVSGAAPFQTYPLLRLSVGIDSLGLACLLVAISALPFLDRRGIEP